MALELGHETVLVSINDDRPFLFDSALAAAMAGGARIRAAFHPIMDIEGTRTSVIALVCDQLGEDARQRCWIRCATLSSRALLPCATGRRC